MILKTIFIPKPTLSDQDIATGLRWMTWEGIVSMGFSSVAGGVILAAFALALGANNSQIGILAAIPPLVQPLQIAAIALLEKVKRRKLVTVLTWLPAQLLWIPIAMIPFFMDVPSAAAVSVLLALMVLRSMLAAFTSCGWNSWVKDLVPQDILGRFFARRQAYATMAGMVFGLGAAFFADYWQKNASPGDETLGYSFAILAGAIVLGLASPVFMSLMPEPSMQTPAQPQSSLFSTLIAPVKDTNYRQLLRFLLFWWFALSLATPFITVYMLDRIGLSISTVMVLSMVGMAASIVFLRVWGRMADRFSNKAVLSACASLYLLVILGWIFTTMPERYFMTIPLIVILQIMAGIAGAGVGLTIGTMSMKLAPTGQATSYLATAGLASSIGAAIGPILGGVFAQIFSTRELSIDISWIDAGDSSDLTALNLTGFDFLFGIAFLLGLISLNMLRSVHEEGEVEREVILDTLNAPMRELVHPISSLPGVTLLGQFPFGYLKRVSVPGLDVALGVTAHQIAEMARMATVAASHTKKISKALEESLSGLTGTTSEIIPQHRFEIARQAVRGAIHSIGDGIEDVGELSHQAVFGVVRALKTMGADPGDALRGAGYGAVQGAIETNSDLAQATIEALQAAKEMAVEFGLEQKTAMRQAADGALQAAEATGPDARDTVKNTISTEMSRIENK